ncbi:Wound-induced protein 1 [Linum grandiflorum]
MYFPREFPLPKSFISSFFSKLTSGDKPTPPPPLDPPDDPTRTNRLKPIIAFLYKALSSHGGPTSANVAADEDDYRKVIGSDLEWWFHGPPGCDYMMRMLTGQSTSAAADSGRVLFRFEPRSIEVVGDQCVIAEGWEGEKVYWVHVWSVRDGVITQFREYFNTWLTVRDVTPPPPPEEISSVSTSPEREKITLWKSRPGDLFKRSLPGLVLAI